MFIEMCIIADFIEKPYLYNMRKLKLIACMALQLVMFISAIGQGYVIKHYDIEDGFAGNEVYCIYQDTLGYLWFGTNNGLSRYDGVRFKNYNSPVLQNDDILRIKEIMGHIYILNLNRQLYFLSDEHIFPANTSIFEEKIDDFIEDKPNNLIWYFSDHLVQYDKIQKSKKHYKHIVKPRYTHPQSFCYDKDSSLLILSDQHVYRFKDRLNSFPYYEQLPTGTRHHIISLVDDMVLLYGYATPVLEFFNDEFRFCQDINPKEGLSRIVDTENDWWIRSGSSIYKVNKKKGAITDFKPFLNDHQINPIFKDHEGNLWFGTAEHGLYCISNHEITNYTSRNAPFTSNHIQKLEIGGDHTIWIGTGNGQVFKLEGEQDFKVFNLPSKNHQVYDLLFQDEKLSIAYYHAGQIIKDELSALSLLDRAKTICIDEESNYWFGTSASISRINLNQKTKDSFASNQRTYAITPFRKQILCGSVSGFYYIDLENLDVQHIQKELSACESNFYATQKETNLFYGFQNSNNYPPKPLGFFSSPKPLLHRYYDVNGDSIMADVRGIAFTADSTICLSTNNAGLYFIKNDTIYPFNEQHGLSSNACNDLFVDSNDNIWIATTKGLNRIKYPSMQHDNYTIEDGLSSNWITSVVRTPDSLLYIGTHQGLLKVHQNKLRLANISPYVHIRKVKVNEKDTTLFSQYELPWFKNNIAIEFMGISFRSKINYSYRLKKDDAWKRIENNNIGLAELSPGEYLFEVKAVTLNGVESKNTAQIGIHIRSPWWQTLWFKILLILSLLAIVILIAILRIRQIQKRAVEKTRVNKQFAELELQALQSQMNPHFVFNALGAIQHYILKQEEKKANRYLTRFSKLMRLFLDSSREKYISLKDELTLLETYLDLEQLRFKDKFDFEIKIDEDLLPDTIEIPSMLIQPFVENAINHGLLYKKDKGHLSIVFQQDNHDNLICLIKDNGVGRKEAMRRKRKAMKSYKSQGTQIVEERLNTLNFIEETNITFDISDILDTSGNCNGTLVSILIPNPALH